MLKTSRIIRVGFLVPGLLLLVPAGWLWQTATLRAADVQAAFGNFKRVSFDPLRLQRSLDIDLFVPDNPSWARLRKKWGDPGYVIAAVANGRNYVYCFDRLALTARATVGQEALPLEIADRPLYGYSAECSSVGLSFRASPGADVRIHIGPEADLDNRPAALIVAPYWTEETKDRLVGYDLANQLRPITVCLAIVGVGLIVCAFRRRPTVSSLAPTPKFN